MPAPELFPVEKVKAAADAVLEESGRVALQYTSTDGWPRLREQIAERMCAALLGPAYKKRGLGGDRLARDIGCSAVDLCGLIPWCIACSVPLQVMGVGAQALPLSFLLYLLPLVTLVKDRLRAKQLKKFPDS